MNIVEVTVTGPRDWMERAVPELLAARLIACAQIWPIHSTYWWEGVVEEADELRAALHTTELKIDEVRTNIQESHPYETSCVIATHITGGNPDYLDWVRQTVATHG